VSLKERVTFFKNFFTDKAGIGSLQPSSRFVAEAMASPLAEASKKHPEISRRVLEMGPGTGSVTRGIVKAMGPNDHLDCYEINETFVDYLRQQVQNHKAYSSVRDRVHVHHGPAQDGLSTHQYDFIICAIPTNNLPLDLFEELFSMVFKSLKPGGYLSYIEYTMLPTMAKVFATPDIKERIIEIEKLKRSYRKQYASRMRFVTINFPPARIYLLQARPN
jgi:phospholipid N-methyltransferase